jgi:hypothetical protein
VPVGGLGAGAVLATVADLAQVPVELNPYELIHRRLVLMPNPACGRGRPKAKGKEKALSSRSSFAGMAAPPRLRCGEGLGGRAARFAGSTAAFACSSAKKTIRTPCGGRAGIPRGMITCPVTRGCPRAAGRWASPA